MSYHTVAVLCNVMPCVCVRACVRACVCARVRACVCVFNPVSHCSSHFVLSILELDWLATELWISSVSYHIITGSFYRGAGDHDTPVFLIVYQLNHLSSS